MSIVAEPAAAFLTDEDWKNHLAGRMTSRALELEFRAQFRAVDQAPTGLRAVDGFSGAGGEGQGLKAAGYTTVLAGNHWDRAIESHQANFPDVDHFRGDLHQDGILEAWPYAEFAWFSPSCPGWSQANGEARTFDKQPSLFDLDAMAEEEREVFAQPGSSEEREKSRALMWDIPRYLEAMLRREGKPVLAGVVENVIEVRQWIRWDAWVASFRRRGYRVRLIAINSMHVQAPVTGTAPQSRDRAYFAFWHESLNRDPDWEKWLNPQARCSVHGWIRATQSWKKPGNDMGRYRSQYVYRCPQVSCGHETVEPPSAAAATAIDWTLPTQRICDRTKPLAPKTRARIAAGLARYRRDPFVAEVAGHTFERRPGVRTRALAEPFTTQHTTASKALAVPLLVPAGGTWRDGAAPVTEPMSARTATESDALLIPMEGRDGKRALAVTEPLRTQTARHDLGLLEVPPLLVPLRNNGLALPTDAGPLPTFAASGQHHALVMRNNNSRGSDAAQGAMLTPLAEPLRTLTTAGHQSLVEWDAALYAYDTGLVQALRQPMPAQTTVSGDALLGAITDDDIDACTLRMLAILEIQAGMAFGGSYIVLGNKRERVRQLGNAVTPNVAEVLGLALRECITGEQLERVELELAA